MSDQNMPNNTTLILSTVASLATTSMLVKTFSDAFVPDELKSYFSCGLYNLSRRFSSQLTIVIDEFDAMSSNQVFDAAETYLGTVLDSSTRRFKVRKGEEEKRLVLMVDKNEEIADVFEDVHVTWQLICTTVKSSNQVRDPDDLVSFLRAEARSYELSFHKKHKEKVLNKYLPYVLERAKAIKEESKTIDLYTINEYKIWCSSRGGTR